MPSQPLLSEFGRFLRGARQKEFPEDTLRDVAAKVFKGTISYALLAYYEKGKVRDPSPALLKLLAKKYRVDYSEIIRKLTEEKYDLPRQPEDNGKRQSRNVIRDATRSSAKIAEFREMLRKADFTFDEDRTGEALLLGMESLVEGAAALTVAGVAGLEKGLPPGATVWVFAREFMANREEIIRDTVVHTLGKGVHYEYFISREFSTQFEDYRHCLGLELRKTKGGRSVNVEKAVTARYVRDEVVRLMSADLLAVHPADQATTLVFQYIRQGENLFGFPLDREIGQKLVGAWRALAKNPNFLALEQDSPPAIR